MTTKLHTFVTGKDLSQTNIAGYLCGRGKNTFKYWETANPMLPAFINCLEGGAKLNKIYSNYPTSPWVAPQGRGVKGTISLDPNNGDGAKMVTLDGQAVLKWPKQVAGRTSDAPLTDGLHAAAQAISAGDKDMEAGTRNKGQKQALRYYMLAAYSLLDIGQDAAFEGLGNMVAALLVSDKGEILAAGINTGNYRHAEVSMLVSYFRKNPAARALPAKSVIFSTLTPCKQCSDYLTVAKAADTVIYFGQSDTGKAGKAGEKIADKISEKTKAPSGRVKQVVTTEDDGGGGVATTAAASTIHKVRIAENLTACLGKGSIAKQVGKADDSRRVLRGASDALIHKVLKDRADGGEDQVKSAVLHYLTYWLSGATLG